MEAGSLRNSERRMTRVGGERDTETSGSGPLDPSDGGGAAAVGGCCGRGCGRAPRWMTRRAEVDEEKRHREARPRQS